MRIDRVKLISLMAERDMPCNRIVKLTGLSRSTVTSVRSGKSCSQETAELIAEALGVDVSELIKKE